MKCTEVSSNLNAELVCNLKIYTRKYECKFEVYKFGILAPIIIYEAGKMFKIEKSEMTNKTFRLPLELVEQLHKVAQNKGISLNNLVKQCCEYALKNLEE